MTDSTRKLPSLKTAKWLNEPRLQQVMAVLNAAGEVRVAGGAVRNALMGIAIADVDLATTLLPQDVIQLAKGSGFAVHPTGLAHGTVTVVNRAAVFEVTTLRRDVETDGRRAMVSFTRSFAEDAARRDFTMNALYCSSHGEIIDYTNGYDDILRKRVKFVGAPAERIAEDYLRILRFFRFHAAYAKGAPDKSGLAACKKLKAGLKQLSAERIRQELFKLLVAPRAVETLKVMAKAGILKFILPHTDEWRVIEHLPPDAGLRLFILAKDSAMPREKLRLSNDEAARLEALHAAPALSPKLREREQRALLYGLGPAAWHDAVLVAQARSKAKFTASAWGKMAKLPARWPIPKLPITGRDLLARGYQPGPQLGSLLQSAEDYWIAGDFKASADELLAHIEGLGS
jgi:tRNA nucleotidyltransferase/poly(A) polymerase